MGKEPTASLCSLERVVRRRAYWRASAALVVLACGIDKPPGTTTARIAQYNEPLLASRHAKTAEATRQRARKDAPLGAATRWHQSAKHVAWQQRAGDCATAPMAATSHRASASRTILMEVEGSRLTISSSATEAGPSQA